MSDCFARDSLKKFILFPISLGILEKKTFFYEGKVQFFVNTALLQATYGCKCSICALLLKKCQVQQIITSQIL